jgi:hypothetical protein
VAKLKSLKATDAEEFKEAVNAFATQLSILGPSAVMANLIGSNNTTNSLNVEA